VTERQDLEHRAHADRVGAERAEHANLGRRLVARTEHPGVDPFVERNAFGTRRLVRQLTQTKIVGLSHVGEAGKRELVRPHERTPSRQIDVIGQQEQSAWSESLTDAARSVRDEHGTATEHREQTRSEDDALGLVAFVEVHTTRETRHGHTPDATEHELAFVSRYDSCREVGDVRIRDLPRALDALGVSPEPRAQNQPDNGGLGGFSPHETRS
jgi:hypothetical protein